MFKPLKRSLLLLVPLFLLAGCNTIVMNPKGDIASQQADLIVLSTVLMLIIISSLAFLHGSIARPTRKLSTILNGTTPRSWSWLFGARPC
jgi:cytochrome o ubiquinol oxidase subunit II